MRIVTVVLCLAVLAACGPNDPDTSDEAPAEPEHPLEREDPRVLPEHPVSDRREALREAMQARREAETGEGADLEAARERRELLREQRRSPGPWWQDEELAEQLGLSESQIAALDAAADRRAEQYRNARQRLVEIERQLAAALATGEIERARSLVDARREERSDLHAAEDDWLDVLLSELDPAQLRQLAEHRPQALGTGPGTRERRR